MLWMYIERGVYRKKMIDEVSEVKRTIPRSSGFLYGIGLNVGISCFGIPQRVVYLSSR